MNILVLQETDWLTRGPHTQHHIFEHLSKNPNINVTIIDYDIEKLIRSKSRFIKKRVYRNIDKTIKNSEVVIIRTAHLQIPYLRRISSLITNFIQMLSIIKENRPNIIIGYSMTNGIIGLFFSKLYKIPYIFYYIDFLHKLVPIAQAQYFARLVSRFVLKFSDIVIVQTKYQRNFVNNEGTSLEKIKILPNGISINANEISENKIIELKEKYFINNKDFVIFFMGYLYDFAGLKEIIDAYNDKVKTGLLDLKFLIVGDGGIYNFLKEYIKEHKADWVILVGRVPFFIINEYISLSDLCLLSFKKNLITKEIIPIKIFEYMAMKKPVLSNKLPGVVLELGINNGVIFADNQEELIKEISNLIPYKNDLKKIGEKGYELVKEKYMWTKIITDFKTVLIELFRTNQK